MMVAREMQIKGVRVLSVSPLRIDSTAVFLSIQRRQSDPLHASHSPMLSSAKSSPSLTQFTKVLRTLQLTSDG